jgi:type I restriction enzyme M protein
MKTIADPSCGTGGFFLAAYDWMTEPEFRQRTKTIFKVPYFQRQ